MDIITGLSAIGQAINIVKDLRELDRSLDVATYKSQIAELYGSLSDAKMALTDAKEELHAKDRKIKELEDAIEAQKSGETCPICEVGRMKVTASRPHPHFAFAGVQERTITCQNKDCGHTEQRLYDPENRTGTNR